MVPAVLVPCQRLVEEWIMFRQSVRRVPSLETLEDRPVPPVQAFFAGGVLAVVGDADPNEITVAVEAGELKVTNNGADVPIQSAVTPTLDQTLAVAVFGQ